MGCDGSGDGRESIVVFLGWGLYVRSCDEESEKVSWLYKELIDICPNNSPDLYEETAIAKGRVLRKRTEWVWTTIST